ncbi:MAG: S8 family serine peptidase [Fimbriimonadaceae bacterium]|nr:S8 family serine peptidase [Fimbriimonadaceae bacterium]QYK55198.1 MAG: S8 family serine peptidase [Fimbriimonadaceae bacterium]
MCTPKFARRTALAALSLVVSGSFATASMKFEDDLAQRLASPSNRPLSVVFYLRRQHAAEAAELLAPKYRTLIDLEMERARRQVEDLRAMPSLSPAEERAAIAAGRYLADPANVAGTARSVDRLRQSYGDEVAAYAKGAAIFDFAHLRGMVNAYGGRVIGETTAVSTLAASLSPAGIRALAADPMVAFVGLDHVGAPELNTSAQSIGATTFWQAGFTGGTYDVGTLDTGCLRTHAAFAGKRFEGPQTVDPDGHGTHVTGIMASDNSTYRGMAPGVDTISVAQAGADSTSMVGMNALMTTILERAESVNYSFGNGTANSNDYAGIDQFFDGVCDTFEVMVSKSTGNGGFSTGITITHPAPAFNLLACANLSDQENTNRADDLISSSSSTGPTFGGRKKPDIGGLGTAITAPYNNGGYASLTGTSMAAPHIGGCVVLCISAGVPGPMAAKALLINTAEAIDSRNTSTTADDVRVPGSFWDKRYGWGYANMSSALIHVPDVFLRTMDRPAPGGKNFKLYKGQMFRNEKATLVWNRHVAYNGSTYPSIVRALSNLNLLAYGSETNSLLAGSTSAIDNVEQVSVGQDGEVVLKVETQGAFDPAVASERYALATQENFSEAVGPVASATFFRQPSGSYLGQFVWRVTVKNTGDLQMSNTEVRVSGYDIVNGENPRNIGNLRPGEERVLEFIAKRRISPNAPVVKAEVFSNSYGESLAWTLVQPGSY